MAWGEEDENYRNVICENTMTKIKKITINTSAR